MRPKPGMPWHALAGADLEQKLPGFQIEPALTGMPPSSSPLAPQVAFLPLNLIGSLAHPYKGRSSLCQIHTSTRPSSLRVTRRYALSLQGGSCSKLHQ